VGRGRIGCHPCAVQQRLGFTEVCLSTNRVDLHFEPSAIAAQAEQNPSGHLMAEEGPSVVIGIVHTGSCCELMLSVLHDLEINFNNLTSGRRCCTSLSCDRSLNQIKR